MVFIGPKETYIHSEKEWKYEVNRKRHWYD